jgi:hypothetical protein
MLLACAIIAGGYFAYEGASLPRVPIRLSGDWLMERDDEMGFVPKRNGSTEIRHLDSGLRYHIFTDGRSARVNAAGAQTPSHVDIVTLGCSFTWGHGVESEQTYAQQLGQILNAPVANFGMGSYGSVQSFQALMRNADLKPKVVVYGFIQDHLRRNLSPCAPNYVPFCLPVSYLKRENDWVVLQPPHMEYFAPEDNRAFMAEIAMRDASGPLDWFFAAKWAARIAWFKYRNIETIAYDDSLATATAGIHAMIGAMADEVKGMGAKLVVVNMPYLRRGRTQPVPTALTSALAGKDVAFVDFGPIASDFYARDAAGTLILGDDPHPNPLAHRMIAEALAPVVEPLLAR